MFRYLVLATLLPLCLSAADLRGRVLNVEGNPVPDANLQIAGSSAGAATADDGSFVIRNLPEGDVVLQVSHLGYKQQRITLQTGSSEQTIQLEESVYAAAPLTVVTGRADATSAVTYSTVSHDRLTEMDHGQDVAQLLEGTPGLVTTSYSGSEIGYNEIRLRGFDQKRIEVLINGVPLNDPEDHYVYWVDVPDLGSSLHDIEIQRGTGSGLLGSSNIGGSVNLVTGLSPTPHLNASITRGSLDTRRYNLGLASGFTGDWLMDARFSTLETAGYRDRTGVEMWSYYASAQRILPGGVIRITHMNGHELTHTAWDGIDESVLFGLNGELQDRQQNNDASYANSVDDFNQQHYQLLWEQTLNESLRSTLTVYHVSGDGYYETYKSGRDAADYGLLFPVEAGEEAPEVDLVNRRWIPKKQTGMNLRMDYTRHIVKLSSGLSAYTYSAEHWGEVTWASITPEGWIPGTRYYTHETEKQRLSAFALASVSPRNDLHLSLRLTGVWSRYSLEQLEEGSFSAANGTRNAFVDDNAFLNPALGACWELSPNLRTYASIGLTWREPSRSEYWNAWEGPDDLHVTPMFRSATLRTDGVVEWSDPLIKPERMLDLEWGIGYRTRDLYCSANLYYMDMHDEIVNFGGLDEESPVKGNAPRSHHAGIELEAEAQVHNSLRMGGNAALSSNKIDELTVYDSAYDAEWNETTVSRDFSGNPIALTPDLVLNGWVNWQPTPWLQLRPGVQFVGKQYLDNSNDDDFSPIPLDSIDPAYLDANGHLLLPKTIAAYATLSLEASLHLQQWLHQDLSLHLHVSNLLNKEYETNGYWNDWVDSNGDWLYEPQRALYPAAGRCWSITMKMML